MTGTVRRDRAGGVLADAPLDVPPDVFEGRDGWLFLVGGTNRVRAQYRAGPAAWWRTALWRRRIGLRAARAAALGARLVHLVVPEKVTVYADLFPEIGLDWRRSPARRLAASLAPRPGLALVDLVGPMRAARAGPDLYARTDTHWTPAGCALAYRALCGALGVAPREDLAARPFVEVEMVRDLGGKLVPPRAERVRNYAYGRDAERVAAGRLLAAYEAMGREGELHVGASAVFRNPRAPSPLRVALFGDSCAHFAPFMLTGMLAETVAELDFVWSSSLDWGHLERVRPDVIVYQMAERFMARVPKDRFDLEAFGARRLARLAAEGVAVPPA